jgi:Nodulation protein Z (NodZ)
MTKRQLVLGFKGSNLHIICERDAGLFSLIQQVIANIPWAITEGRIPVVYFRDKTCYWTPNGYRGRDTVWEYYFEPVVATHPASTVPRHLRDFIALHYPSPFEIGYAVGASSFVSNHFGDHPALEGRALSIPYLWDDPSGSFRWTTARIINRFIRPRTYIRKKADQFFEDRLDGSYVIGVHARGTDAVSTQEVREHRQGSLRLPQYAETINGLLKDHPTAKIFVATDDQVSLEYFLDAFGRRVAVYNTIRHRGGQPAAVGPTGWIMPAYIAADRDRAARSGEEAVIDYLLLSRCDHLIHNGSSLARTVLLRAPQLVHTNTHRPPDGRHRDERSEPVRGRPAQRKQSNRAAVDGVAQQMRNPGGGLALGDPLRPAAGWRGRRRRWTVWWR